MHGQLIYTRFIGAFLLVFVCLNATGAACVAYCRSLDETPAAATSSDRHCGKTTDHQNGTAFSIAEKKFDCCPMVAGLVAGPFEPKRTAPAIQFAAINEAQPKWPLPTFERTRFPASEDYRGPPEDRSRDRLRYCILRI